MAKLLSGTRIYGTGTVDTRLFVNGGIGVSSTNTGALQVAGGVGVWGGIFASGIVTATQFIGSLTGTVSTATQAVNLIGGILGQIPYQTAPNTTAFIGTGSQNSILVMGANTASFVTSSSVQVGFAANLLAGAAGSVPYQTAANATAMLALSGTSGALLTAGASAPAYITQVTARNGTGSISTASGQSLVVSNGGLGVIGNSHFADDVNVRGALTVAGGTTFNGSVTFNGSATFVYSTNTFYTDNIINLHTPAGGVANTWTSNDGKDIGLTFHNFVDGYDNNAFIGWNNTSGYLEWWSKGVHEEGGVFTGTQYGIFRTGGILLQNTTGVNNATSGALQVVGGVGIGGGLFVSGVITATSFVGTFSGTADRANNLTGGILGQIPYQLGVNSTAFIGTGTAGTILQMGANTASFVATSTIYVNRATLADNDAGGAAGGLRYQTGANASTFLSIGTAGQILRVNSGATAPEWIGTASIYAGAAVSAINLFGGTAGQLHYQSAAGVTAFAGPGTAGQLLVSAGTGAPTYTNTGSIYVGFSNQANNIRAGTVGQLVYQSAANTTGFVGPGTAGQLLVSAGAAIPVYTNTGSIYVGFANQANNLLAGTAGQLHYQSAPGVTAFAGPGTAGQVLTSGGTGAPTYVSTTTLYVGRAVTADSATGSAGSVTAQLQTANATYFPTFVDSNNAAATAELIYTTSTLQINPGTRQVGIGGFINTSSMLTVNGRIESITDTAGEGGQFVLRGKAFYRWGIDNFEERFRIIREDDVTEANGVETFSITSSTLSVQIGTGGTPYGGEKLGVNGGGYFNGIVTATTFAGNLSGNLVGGTAGQLVYQSAPNTTAFAGPGTAGQVLTSGGTGAPTYVTTTTLYVGRAISADSASGTSNFANNLNGGILGQILYQSAPNTTAFIGTGTQGSILQMGANTATFVTTANIYVNSAVNAQTLFGGTAGQLVYQSAAGTTAFAGPGSAGNVLTSGGTGAPTYISTGTLYVGRALLADSLNNFTTATLMATAVNLNGGALGQIPYQLAAGSTAFIGTGTAGTILQMGANTATFVSTSSIQVGFAANLLAGAAGSIPYQSAANATAMLGIGAGNSILVSNGSVPSWTQNPTIGGNLIVTGNLTVQGTTVVVDSTVTNISDPIITIGGSSGGTFPVADDGKDRGIAFIWTGTQAGLNTARTGFFGFDRSTLYFTFVTSASITNEVIAPAGGTTRGAIDANLAGGTAGQLVYQSAADTTAFAGPGTAGQVLTSGGTGAPTYVSTTTLYVGRALVADSAPSATSANNINGGILGQIPYQLAAGSTAFIGTGTQGSLLQMGANTATFVTTANIYVNSSVNSQNIFGGTAGQLVYQSAAGTTAFAGPGSAGNVLTSNGTSAPSYVTTTSLYVGRALIADTATGGAGSANNLSGGALGQIPYQLASGSTAFIGTGTAGTILQMGANTATFVATSTIYVNRATLADNDAGGAAGGLRYQTGANASTFLSIGTAGQILRVNSGATAPEWIGTASVYAGAAVSSQNIFGGTAGQLHYQSAAGVTAFAGPGTAGQVLTSGGTGAPTYVTTTTLYIGRSLLADTATTVSVVAQPANATYFPIFVDSNNATAAPESLFSTSSFTVNPSTGRVGINTAAAAASTLQVTGDVRISGITTVTNTTGAIATNTAAFQVAGGVGIGGGMVVGGVITATTINVVSYANYPRILNDVSGYADNVRAIFPLTVDQTAVTGLVDNRDLQVMVDGVYQAPFVRERGLPWINDVYSYRGFRVVTTGTSANFLVLYNPPDIGAQIVITQINISTSTQIRSYPYSAAMIGLGD